MYDFGPFFVNRGNSAGQVVVTRIRPGNFGSDKTFIRIREIPVRVGLGYNRIRSKLSDPRITAG